MCNRRPLKRVFNRTASHLSASHVTDDANRLTEDDSFCYAYDANGNLVTKTEKVAGVCTGGVTAYGYDIGNKLTQIDFPDFTTATYAYDGLGRRIEKDVDGVITRYVYDGEDIVMEFDGAGTLLARYSHGDRTDQHLSVERAGQSFFYHADHRGSVRLITDAAGFVVNSYEYDSYGNIESSIEGIANPFTFTGREFDAESGLYYYRARYYDPETGRFITEDPIHFAGLDINLYRYVFNNPANLVDPFGLFCLSPEAIGAISGGAGGAVNGAINGWIVGGPAGAAAGAVGGGFVGAGTGAAIATVADAISNTAARVAGSTAIGAAGGATENAISKRIRRKSGSAAAATFGGAFGGAFGGGGGGAAGGGAAAAINAILDPARGPNRLKRILKATGKALTAGGIGGLVATGLDVYLTTANNCDEC